MSRHTVVVRADGLGDVVLAGPAVRAAAATSSRITMLCSARGEPAARRLPGVDDVIVVSLPWSETAAPPMHGPGMFALVEVLRNARIDEAMILTSSHQSPLPTAVLLRQAGVARIGGTTIDHPGSLLDIALRHDDDIHEVERSLRLAYAMGCQLPPGDSGALELRSPMLNVAPVARRPYVVVHPGASVPARTWSTDRWTRLVPALADSVGTVIVTGTGDEGALTSSVAAGSPHAVDYGGRLDLDALLALLAAAEVVVTGNTGPAHLAAAVGTPVVSLFAPTVPPARWRPWQVPCVLVGRHDLACVGCRARTCPLPRQVCLDDVSVAAVVDAVTQLAHPLATAVAQ